MPVSSRLPLAQRGYIITTGLRSTVAWAMASLADIKVEALVVVCLSHGFGPKRTERFIIPGCLVVLSEISFAGFFEGLLSPS